MKRILLIALIAAPCLLALSYPWRHAKHGAGAILSGIGWFGFVLAVLTVVVLSITAAVRKARAAN